MSTPESLRILVLKASYSLAANWPTVCVLTFNKFTDRYGKLVALPQLRKISCVHDTWVLNTFHESIEVQMRAEEALCTSVQRHAAVYVSPRGPSTETRATAAGVSPPK